MFCTPNYFTCPTCTSFYLPSLEGRNPCLSLAHETNVSRTFSSSLHPECSPSQLRRRPPRPPQACTSIPANKFECQKRHRIQRRACNLAFQIGHGCTFLVAEAAQLLRPATTGLELHPGAGDNNEMSRKHSSFYLSIYRRKHASLVSCPRVTNFRGSAVAGFKVLRIAGQVT